MQFPLLLNGLKRKGTIYDFGTMMIILGRQFMKHSKMCIVVRNHLHRSAVLDLKNYYLFRLNHFFMDGNTTA